jgi:hypothetical protein
MLCRSAAVALLFLSISQAMAVEWSHDYAAAYKQARTEGKYLLIWFSNDEPTSSDVTVAAAFEREDMRELLEPYVLVRIAKSSKVEVNGEQVRLLEHRSFAEMLRLPGLAIIDLRDKQNSLYGSLVSVYPFHSERSIDLGRFKTLLTLPTGTLTQRTLVFAVRTHRDAPRSTRGQLDSLLVREASKHAAHQASITLQGHHQWDRRFQLISAQLPGGLLAQEVCAESWPGQPLLEAAEECVHSWRQSSGHWSAVSKEQPRYGYDMQRGRNGVWYATGIFGTR